MDWSKLADMVSVLAFPIIAASALAAFYQIRSQSKSSRDQAALAALVEFYNKYAEVRAYRVECASRFRRQDHSLGYDDVLHYFSLYWSYRELEWKYFERGLLGPDSLLEWAENALRHIGGKRDLHYFDNGETKLMESRDRFENYALVSILKLSRSRVFYEELLALARKCEEKGVLLDSPEVIEHLKRLVKRFSKLPRRPIV